MTVHTGTDLQRATNVSGSIVLVIIAAVLAWIAYSAYPASTSATIGFGVAAAVLFFGAIILYTMPLGKNQPE